RIARALQLRREELERLARSELSGREAALFAQERELVARLETEFEARRAELEERVRARFESDSASRSAELEARNRALAESLAEREAELERRAKDFEERRAGVEAAAQEQRRRELEVRELRDRLVASFRDPAGTLPQAAFEAEFGRLADSVHRQVSAPAEQLLERIRERLSGIWVSQKERATLESIAGDLEDLRERLSRVQDFGRPLALSFAPVDLRAELEAALEAAAPRLSAAKIEVTRDFADGLPPLPADGPRLREVFAALLENALEAMPSGGRLALALRQLPTRRALEVELSDSGVGAAPEVLRAAAQPFFSAKGKAGLGLAEARRILLGHGGGLRLASDGPGRGVRATVVLPLKR
ncbi:MAG TPA: ATP-binding protein, partial [Elusimicrobiota bacterium]|nr:ATP-binding protein [Elusimicrobiota bacterium]